MQETTESRVADPALAAVARRLVLALLAALAAWEVGRVVASFLVTQVLASGASAAAGGGPAVGTLVALLLQVAVALAVAAPVALLLLRPVLAYRDRE